MTSVRSVPVQVGSGVRLWDDWKVAVMDAATLRKAMPGLSAANAGKYLPHVNRALAAAQCTTVNRSAMFCAQVGEESGSLKWMEEIADGSDYEGRKDLGNTQPGDGRRFKGRGPIQLTGRNNYGAFSRWAHAHGYVNSDTYFVDHPEQVSSNLEFAFLAASWYWMSKHPHDGLTYLNEAADHDNVVTATHMVNGGEHGLDDRRNRYEACKKLGNAILPSGAAPRPPVPVQRPTPAPTVTHYRVQPGDTLGEIAAHFKTSVGQLQAWNRGSYPSLGSNPNLIRIGWVLVVHQNGAPAAATPQVRRVTVRQGQTLSQIAAANRTTVDKIVGWNTGAYPSLARNRDLIQPGWVLRVA